MHYELINHKAGCVNVIIFKVKWMHLNSLFIHLLSTAYPGQVVEAPDFSFPEHIIQLWLWDLDTFAGRCRGIISPRGPGSAPRPPPSWTCLVHFQTRTAVPTKLFRNVLNSKTEKWILSVHVHFICESNSRKVKKEPKSKDHNRRRRGEKLFHWAQHPDSGSLHWTHPHWAAAATRDHSRCCGEGPSQENLHTERHWIQPWRRQWATVKTSCLSDNYTEGKQNSVSNTKCMTKHTSNRISPK